LNNELQKSYTIVDKPGPDTIVLRSAITEAKKSAPVRNLLTSIVPFGIAANILVTAAFGTGIGVGEVQVEPNCSMARQTSVSPPPWIAVLARRRCARSSMAPGAT